MNAIKIKIDSAGRVVIPKAVRTRLGFRPGTRIEALEEGRGLVLKSTGEKPAMVKKNGLWVHLGEPAGPMDLRTIIDDLRGERHRKILGA